MAATGEPAAPIQLNADAQCLLNIVHYYSFRTTFSSFIDSLDPLIETLSNAFQTVFDASGISQYRIRIDPATKEPYLQKGTPIHLSIQIHKKEAVLFEERNGHVPDSILQGCAPKGHFKPGQSTYPLVAVNIYYNSSQLLIVLGASHCLDERSVAKLMQEVLNYSSSSHLMLSMPSSSLASISEQTERNSYYAPDSRFNALKHLAQVLKKTFIDSQLCYIHFDRTNLDAVRTNLALPITNNDLIMALIAYARKAEIRTVVDARILLPASAFFPLGTYMHIVNTPPPAPSAENLKPRLTRHAQAHRDQLTQSKTSEAYHAHVEQLTLMTPADIKSFIIRKTAEGSVICSTHLSSKDANTFKWQGYQLIPQLCSGFETINGAPLPQLPGAAYITGKNEAPILMICLDPYEYERFQQGLNALELSATLTTPEGNLVQYKGISRLSAHPQSALIFGGGIAVGIAVGATAIATYLIPG